jgi:hypothetical protein
MVRVCGGLVCIGLALAGGGCGQADDRERVRSVMQSFLAAYAGDDGEDACAWLTEDTREALEAEEAKPCAVAITELELDDGDVAHVEVFVTNAKADLTTGESAFLSEQTEGWRLSALGCRPDGGAPTDRPFECEIEA